MIKRHLKQLAHLALVWVKRVHFFVTGIIVVVVVQGIGVQSVGAGDGEWHHKYKEMEVINGPAFPLSDHIDQHTITDVPVAEIIGSGGKLFNTKFNRLDGVGSNLSGDPQGTIRFTRLPRMDLPGFASNPTRNTGPNSQSCKACHGLPFEGGAGALIDMEIRDPFRSGDPNQYIQRNPLHLWGSGALQRLAEETTQELKAMREFAINKAVETGQPVTIDLITSNGVHYGQLTTHPSGNVDTSNVAGINTDLIVRPYTWKGSFVTFLRPLVSLGTDTQMGMPAAEFFGATTDFDFDGVINEMSIGDITAMTLYIASLPRPITKLELSDYLGRKYKLSNADKTSIQRGQKIFADIGCAECHKPAMKLNDTVFREPSAFPEHRFPFLPSGQNPLDVGLDPQNPVMVNLAVNPQVGNEKNDAACRKRSKHKFHYTSGHKSNLCFLQYETDDEGRLVVRSYGDLKRHDMGPGLAENIDEAGTGPSVWKTRELWGVGNTGPWLHDGRATTLAEAILFHGGDAQVARDQFAALNASGQHDVVNFLDNLILYKPPKKALP